MKYLLSLIGKQRIAWLDASNAELQRELQDSQAAYELLSKHILKTQVQTQYPIKCFCRILRLKMAVYY